MPTTHPSRIVTVLAAALLLSGCADASGEAAAAERLCADIENEPSDELALAELDAAIERETRRGFDRDALRDALDDTCGRLIAALGTPVGSVSSDEEQVSSASSDEQQAARAMCRAMDPESSGDPADFETSLGGWLALGHDEQQMYDALVEECGDILAAVAPNYEPGSLGQAAPPPPPPNELDDAEPEQAEEEPITDDDLGRALADSITLPDLHGNANPAYDRDPGRLAITTGNPDRGQIPLVLHNGTDDVVSNIELTGRFVYDGQVIDSIRLSTVAPFAIKPDGLAIGYVWTDVDQLPDGVSIDDLQIDYDTGIQMRYRSLVIDELIRTAGGFTGVASSPHEGTFFGPIGVTIACFDAGGNLDTVATGFTDRENLATGDTTTFSVDQRSATRACDSWAAAVDGLYNP